MSYTAPVKDMLFVMKELADIESIAALPGFEDANLDTAQAVLDEAAKFNGEVLAPLNVEGDSNPSTWANGEVTTTPGFKDAFRQFGEGGWQGVHASGRIRRTGLAEADRDAVHRNAERGEPVVRAVSAADRRRDRSAADRRHRRTEAALSCRS